MCGVKLGVCVCENDFELSSYRVTATTPRLRPPPVEREERECTRPTLSLSVSLSLSFLASSFLRGMGAMDEHPATCEEKLWKHLLLVNTV